MNPNSPVSRGTLIVCFLGALAVAANAQSWPSSPRLVYNTSELAAINAKVNNPANAKTAGYFASLATSATTLSGGQSLTYWRSTEHCRQLMEVAARYAITGDPVMGDRAKTVLLSYLTAFAPSSNSRTWRTGSYPIVMAIVYDWVRDRLSSSERARVVSYLTLWANTLTGSTRSPAGTNFNGYTIAADNYGFGMIGGAGMAAIALLGENSSTSQSRLEDIAFQSYEKLALGMNDTFSPDGSYDEGIGYATYGGWYSIYTMRAAERVLAVGNPTRWNAMRARLGLSGSEDWRDLGVGKSAWWAGATLVGDQYDWRADSNEGHRGLGLDPTLLATIAQPKANETAEQARFRGETLWAIDRVFTKVAPSYGSSTHCFSPFVSLVLFYPEGSFHGSPAPVAPRTLSHVYRTNRNITASNGRANKWDGISALGNGGQAFMFDEVRSDARTMMATHIANDEWANHGHEDDGHVSIGLGGELMYRDIGSHTTNGPGRYFGAHSVHHNVVKVAGSGGFSGLSNNFYEPPAPDGSFGGSITGQLLGTSADYFGGEHSRSWVMSHARRNTLMVRSGPNGPGYVLVNSHVDDSGSTRDFEELWWGTARTSGAGTVSNPMTMQRGAHTIRSVYLSPSSVSMVRGQSISSWRSHYENKIVARGSELSFVSVHGADAPITTSPLLAASPNTRGGLMAWANGAVDRTLSAYDRDLGISDADVNADANLVWIREDAAGALVQFVIAEALNANYRGVQLFSVQAGGRLTVAQSEGVIDISSADGSAASVPSVTVHALGRVDDVRFNGEPVPFTKNGSVVTLGGLSLPASSSDDVAITFTAGITDAIEFPQGACSTAGGELSTRGGNAYLKLRPNMPFAARPFTVGAELEFAPFGPDLKAELQFAGANASFDLLRVFYRLSGFNSVNLEVSSRGASLGSVSFPLPPGMSPRTRFTMMVDTFNDEFVIMGPDQVELSRLSVPAGRLATITQTRFFLTDQVKLDNITIFDSAEDGRTAGGITTYVLPDGRVGVFARGDRIFYGAIRPVLNGTIFDQVFSNIWLQQGGFQDVLFRPLNSRLQTVAHIKELGFESTRTAAIIQRGSSAGALVITGSGELLYGEQNF